MAKKSKKLPKRIAGFKIPKAVRKSPVVRSLLANPIGRDVLAKALLAGAGAAAAILVEEREEIAHAGNKGAKKAERAAGIVGHAMQNAVRAAVNVVKDAVPGSFTKAVAGKGSAATAH